MTTSTSAIRQRFTPDRHLGMGLPGLHGRNHAGVCFYDPDDDGGDGGGDGGDGGDGGAGGGDDKFVEFKADTEKFKFPGMDKPMTVKEYQAKVQSDIAAGSKTEAGKLLVKMIESAKAGRKPQGQQGQQQSQPQRRASDKRSDPLSLLEANELPDGKTIAGVLRQAYDGNIAPLAKAVIALSKKMESLEKGVGPLNQERDEVQFGGEIQKAIASLKLPQIAGKSIEGQDVLSEMVRDLYYSYDDADRPKLSGDVLAKLVKDRFTQYQKFFKAHAKAELEAARDRQKQRIFAKPGANTSVNGKQPARLSNRQVADFMFDGVAPNA